MICLACAEPVPGDLCASCRRSLAPAPEQHLGGVLVRSAYAHDGAARRLVHRLKYGALPTAAQTLAEAMLALLPSDAGSLVPIPRVGARRWRHGVDPAAALATAMAKATGLPVVDALGAPWWVARRAGPAGSRRGVPRFSLRHSPGRRPVLVDDVVTTGTTLRAAAAASDVRRAVTATAAVRRPDRQFGPDRHDPAPVR